MKNISQILVLASTMMLSRVLQAGSLEGAVLIANESVRIDHISADALKSVYTGRTNYWQGGQSVVLAVLANRTDGALQQVSGMDASQFRTFWQRLVFSGRGQEPKTAEDAETLVRLVASTKGAIALIPGDTALKGVKVVEVK